MSGERKEYEVLKPVVWGGEARKPGYRILLNDEEARSYSADEVRIVEPGAEVSATPAAPADEAPAAAAGDEAVKPPKKGKGKKK